MGETYAVKTDYEYDAIGRLTYVDYNQPDDIAEEYYVYDGALTFFPGDGHTVTLRGGDNGKGRLTATLVRVYGGSADCLMATDYAYEADGRVSESPTRA